MVRLIKWSLCAQPILVLNRLHVREVAAYTVTIECHMAPIDGANT